MRPLALAESEEEEETAPNPATGSSQIIFVSGNAIGCWSQAELRDYFNVVSVNAIGRWNQIKLRDYFNIMNGLHMRVPLMLELFSASAN
jgi:hypothetical protein